jgi:DNA (cytosine-5)-methyltransferase 1
MTTTDIVLEAFAGPGGATLGLHHLGLTTVGIEWDPDACATRAAAGLPTIRADVATVALDHLAGRVAGVWASPPCPTFAVAGAGSGVDEVPDLLDFAAKFAAGGWHDPWDHHDWDDPRTPLVLEPLRFVDVLHPDWVVLEQVPPVLVIWEAFARVLADRGYSTWAGILNAADYGVPQTRRRAFLIASRTRLAHPPTPTHAKDPAPTLFGDDLAPWVTMATALGWHDPHLVLDRRSPGAPLLDPGTEPAPTVTGAAIGRGVWEVREAVEGDVPAGDRYGDAMARRRLDPAPWPYEAPATTVAGDPRITARCHHDEGSQGANAKTTEQVRAGDYTGTEPIRLTLADALTLQGFPTDYPVAGARLAQFVQIGNAVPPPLAAAVAATVTTGGTP